MRKFLLSLVAIFTCASINAQSCSELFISTYVEGSGNNRAIELYNPTANAIDLSGYSVGRFSNGSTSFTPVQLPNDMIQPYGNYVIVLDKRDSSAIGLEVPIWDGYQVWDTCFDNVTGDPLLDTTGNVRFCVQYDQATSVPLRGSVYNDFLDLQGRADVFVCPDYNVNKAMYFNGNDAVALISGTALDPVSGSNLIDVIGIIGDDPGSDQGWATASGSWITRNRTLVRKPYIEHGSGSVVKLLGDTLAYDDWTMLPNNTFTVLDGQHDCQCDPNYVSTQPINIVDFNVYPNPTSGAFVVEAAERINRVEVYNMVGQVVYSNTSFNSDKANVHLNTKNKGLHIVKIYFDNDSIAIQKLLVD